MANRDACELWIEQEIESGLEDGKIQMVSYDARSLYVDRRCLWPEEEGRFRVSRPEAHLQHQHAESRCPGICDHGYHWTFNQGNVRPV